MSVSLGPIAAEVSVRYGWMPRKAWEPIFERAVDEVARRLGASVEEALERIRHDPALVHELAERVTVPETHFMRHAGHFEYLERDVPDRLRRYTDGQRVRIWSAGCSTGEEIYTAAMVLDSCLREHDWARVHLVANDLSGASVDKARRGVYSHWSFRGTPDRMRAHYFEALEGDKFLLSSRIRERVTFQHAAVESTIATLGFASCDLVFFRNVGIYLTPERLDEVFAGMRRVLKPDGVLMVAPGDPWPSRDLFEREVHGESTIYRPINAEAKTLRSTKPPHSKGSASPRSRINGAPARRLEAAASAARVRPKSKASADRHEVNDPLELFNGDLQAAVQFTRDLADQGDLNDALEQARAIALAMPNEVEPQLLLGQLHLAAAGEESATQHAVESLRHAVYLQPAHVLARYWYAVALTNDSRADAARRQLDAVAAQLENMDRDRLLEDAETSAGELLEAVVLMHEVVR
ncbi:MAG: CheR family methyltransferase [Gammaproteobacteria bacterium]